MVREFNALMTDFSDELYLVSTISKLNGNMSLTELKFISKTRNINTNPNFGLNVKTEIKTINKTNAFKFFQSYKDRNDGVFDMMTKLLSNTDSVGEKFNIRNFVMPINYLLKQAEALGLENSNAYKGLKQRNRELCALLLKVENIPDLSEIVLNDFDIAINNLLIIMSRFIH